MQIIGVLLLFYLTAIALGKRTKTMKPGTYYLMVLLALAQALFVLFNLYNTPVPKP
ncbi:MAG TPA: hypothetical protein VI758_09015 [Bacteroidota bacterium]